MQVYPQNYLYLGISSPLIIGLFVITLMKLMKKSASTGFMVKLFLVSVLLVVVYNWIIKWVVGKDHQSIGWVLALLPLVTVAFMGYYYVEHEKCLSSMHSIFSECIPSMQQRLITGVTSRLGV